jgi:hypothetical protein
MKRLYLFTLVLSIIGLSVFCWPAIPSNLPFVDRLALHPDKWELRLNDPDQKVFRLDEPRGKARLLAFLQRYRHTYETDVGWLTSGLAVAMAFSLLGWIRENELQKSRAEPAASPNGGPSARLAESAVGGGPPSVS